jgi:hypothetical protein
MHKSRHYSLFSYVACASDTLANNLNLNPINLILSLDGNKLEKIKLPNLNH